MANVWRSRWNELKSFVVEYRREKIGKDEDGEYQVAISVSDILKVMGDIERCQKPKI